MHVQSEIHSLPVLRFFRKIQYAIEHLAFTKRFVCFASISSFSPIIKTVERQNTSLLCILWVFINGFFHGWDHATIASLSPNDDDYQGKVVIRHKQSSHSRRKRKNILSIELPFGRSLLSRDLDISKWIKLLASRKWYWQPIHPLLLWNVMGTHMGSEQNMA